MPERAAELRKHIIERSARPECAGGGQNEAERMEDIFVAVQLYSYAPGYVVQRPTIERIAETVDKLEEDVLGLRTATIRGRRRATIRFGEPLLIEQAGDRAAPRSIAAQMQDRVQALIEPTS